ncbi:unnamed protein product [Ectocarpus sp. 8 AP-2014]
MGLVSLYHTQQHRLQHPVNYVNIYVDYAYLEMMPHKVKLRETPSLQKICGGHTQSNKHPNRGSLNCCLLRRLLVTFHLPFFVSLLSGCDMLISTVHKGMLCHEE